MTSNKSTSLSWWVDYLNSKATKSNTTSCDIEILPKGVVITNIRMPSFPPNKVNTLFVQNK